MINRTVLYLLALVLPVCGASLAHEVQHGGISVKHPWVRAAPKGAAAAEAAVKITNHGKTADRLVGARLDGAASVAFVTPDAATGVPLAEGQVVIAPGETVDLKTDGRHLVFKDLSTSLDEDSYVDGVLVFEKAGEMPVDFYVEP